MKYAVRAFLEPHLLRPGLLMLASGPGSAVYISSGICVVHRTVVRKEASLTLAASGMA